MLLQVVTWCPTCGDTRTEVDFAARVRVLIESEPDAKKWDLITDCLNTHQSESCSPTGS